MTFDNLAKKIIDAQPEDSNLSIESVSGEVDILKISVKGREELPIFISMSMDEILCMSYLFKEDEINNATKPEMHEAMLQMNIPMPLSSFSKVKDQYILLGTLSSQSSINAILQEINILSDNSLEALRAMKDYLQ